jgi:hypothetical protein
MALAVLAVLHVASKEWQGVTHEVCISMGNQPSTTTWEHAMLSTWLGCMLCCGEQWPHVAVGGSGAWKAGVLLLMVYHCMKHL